MQELKNKAPWKIETAIHRNVTFFIDSTLYTITGHWNWELYTESLFCSDVMITAPTDINGTRCLLHPDDAQHVRELLPDLTNEPFALSFRVITTYGEIKFIEGIELALSETQTETSIPIQLAAQASAEQELKELHQLYELFGQMEKVTGAGAWYYNTATQKTWYSNYIYRIYDLPPQSLNAHLNTFHSFIHADEREVVTEYIDEAYRKQAPLHIEFRIVTGKGEKKVQYMTHWAFSEKGETILQGTIRDITEWNALLDEKETFKRVTQFQKHLLLQDEQNAQLGHWQIDLVTREVIYSDNFYRQFGQKPQSLSSTLTAFLNYIHPDDREEVEIALKRIRTHHQLDDLEFRVIRSDGRIRHLVQKGRLFSAGGTMVVAGTLQDITIQKTLDLKLAAAKKDINLYSLLLKQSEEYGLLHWTWDLTNQEIKWSDSIYRFFSYKPGSSGFSFEKFVKYVHSEDRNLFKDLLRTGLEQQKDTAISFRLILGGEEHYFKGFIHFRTLDERTVMIAMFRDVSIEEKDQNAQQQRMRLANALVENVKDRIIITDSSNTIILWNEQCVRIYGIKREAALGKNFFSLFPQLKTEEEISLFNQVLRGEAVQQSGYRSNVIKGFYDVHMLPLWNDEATEVTGILHIIHDVTQETELRQNLNERLQFIEQLVEATVDRIIVLDRNMNYVYWNKKAEQYYGIEKDDVLCKNILELFPNFRNDPAYDAFRMALRGETVHIPAEQNGADKANYYETYLVPVKNEKQQVTSILWIVHDLSAEWALQQERFKSVQLLKEEHQRLKEVQQIGHVGSFEWIAATDAVLWSDEMYRIYGLEEQSETITIERILSFIHPDDKASVIELVRTCHSVPGEYTFVHRIVRKDGHIRTIKRQIKSFADANGTVTHLSGTAQDITEQEEKEKQLNQQKHFLQRITETIPDMLSVMELPSRKLSFLNGEAFAANGFDPAVMATKTREELIEIIHADDRQGLNEYYEYLGSAPDDEIVTAEYRARDLTGEWKWFRVRGKVFQRDESGTVKQILNAIQNITDHKKKEHELKNNLAILKQAEEQARMGSWEYDFKSKTFNWSEGMYTLFGLPKGLNVTPQQYLALVMPEDQRIVKRMMNYLQSKHQDFEEMFRVKQHDIGYRLIKCKGSVVYDENGSPEKIIGVDIDITDICKAEEKLNESRHWLEQTSLASPDAITVYDLKNRQPVYLNHCLSEWLGYSDEELKAMGSQGRLELMHPDDRLQLLLFNERIAAAPDNKILKLEYRIYKKNGDLLWVRNRAKVFQRDSSEIATHSISFLQDITEEKLLGEQLKERKQLVEDILNNSIDRIMVLDKKLRIVGWNRRSEEHFGRKKEEVTGELLTVLFQNISKDQELMQAYDTALKGEFVHIAERSSIYGNGYTEVFVVPLKNDNGDVYALLSIAHDVTKRVMAELELRELNKTLEQKNKELAEKNEEITHFAFVASHDLKEPIRKIHTFSDWLLQQESEHISVTGKNYVQKIANASRRLEALIEDILVLTKIHSDNQGRKDIDLNNALKEAKEELKDWIEVTDAEINSDDLPVLHANPNQLHYLFTNLLSNGLKFQSPGNKPVLNIRAEIMEGSIVDAEEAKIDTEYLKLCFADNGFGFEPKYKKKIFQVFQRLHGKHEYTGTGMGLAICKKIMDNHDGFITAETVEGSGSVFCCYFPI